MFHRTIKKGKISNAKMRESADDFLSDYDTHTGLKRHHASGSSTAKSPVRDFIQSSIVQSKLNNPNYSNKIENLAENFFKDLKQSQSSLGDPISPEVVKKREFQEKKEKKHKEDEKIRKMNHDKIEK